MQHDLEAFYEIQFLVPKENAIGGNPFWSTIQFPSGNLRTTDFEMAKSHYQLAQKEIKEPVRLVKFTPEQIHF